MLKCSIHFECGRKSWTETHATLAAGLEQAEEALKRLVALRVQLLGRGASFTGARIHDTDPARDSRVVVWDDMPKINVKIDKLADPEEYAADQPNACVLLRLESAGSRFRSLYLAGIPDAVIRGDPPRYYPQGWPPFEPAFKKWKAELIGGPWGFIAKVKVANGADLQQISSVLRLGAAPNRLGVVVPAAGAAPAPGSRVNIKGMVPANRISPYLHGEYQVSSVVAGPDEGTRTVYLMNTEHIDVSNMIGHGFLQIPTYEVAKYDRIIPMGVTTRKRGVGYNPPRGRSRARRANR